MSLIPNGPKFLETADILVQGETTVCFVASPWIRVSLFVHICSQTLNNMSTDCPALERERGLCIVFEGGDRAGKGTQVQLLLDALNAIQPNSAISQHYPDRSTQMGQLINAYLQNKSEIEDHALHMLFSANRWEKQAQMQKQLLEGTHVVVDRYAFSGIAYSTAKNSNLTMEWCCNPDRGLVSPDLVVFLQMDAEEASKRAGWGDERYEKKELQKQCVTRFQELHQLSKSDEPTAFGKDIPWICVDATQTPKVVHTLVMQRVIELLESPRKQLSYF